MTTVIMIKDADRVLKERFEQRLHGLDSLSRLFHMLRMHDGPIDYTYTERVYNTANSIAQGNRSKRGKALEDAMASLLMDLHIPFVSQVSHNDQGLLTSKKRGCVHDIVLYAKMGDPIRDKIVVSCKTSVRERYKQDGIVPCKKLFLVTVDRASTRNNQKYKDIGIYMVHVGHDQALERMLQEVVDAGAAVAPTPTPDAPAAPPARERGGAPEEAEPAGEGRAERDGA